MPSGHIKKEFNLRTRAQIFLNLMSKKREFPIKYSRIVNGEEYTQTYTVTGVKNKTEAIEKLKKLCKQAGGPEPIIIE